MRLSISAKIFVGFLIVLGTFGAVAAYGAWSMRRLGDELRLVSRGYLELRLQVSELQQGQSNLLRVLADQRDKAESGARTPRFVKFAIDDARRLRLKQAMPTALADIRALEALRSSADEHALLRSLKTRLERIESEFTADEELFDAVFGAIGDPPIVPAAGETARSSIERLLRREQAIKRDLNYLSAELRLRAQQASLRLEEEERRAVWILLILAVTAIVVGLVVMVVATYTLRPLRRLADRAKQIARGDYRQRVDVTSPDEIGALAHEFNAMATALDEREQRLIRSERLAAVGKIAAQITHEVRNPLSSIGLNAEQLDEELSTLATVAQDPEGRAHLVEARALTRSIVKEVDRLTEITEEYLRFARLPRPRLEREDLPTLVRSLVQFTEAESARRGVRVVVRAEPGLPAVAADEQQLRQALLNLMRNAIEAMPEGGTLELDARLAAPRVVELRVSDTGQGIRAENLGKIFDPFFSTKEGGTGLGLALTQQIVTEHGGRIAVEQRPGGGSCFVVTLASFDGFGQEPAPADLN